MSEQAFGKAIEGGTFVMEKNMTVGNPARIILEFVLPIFLGNLFQQLYSMVDTIIVGKFVGTKALAAVGATGNINFLILGFLMGLTAGFTVLTSQRFGAGDLNGMRRSVGTAAILSIAASVVMTIISMISMRGLLTLMNTPEDIFDGSYTYIMIICGGIFAQVLYNLLAGILRALGNSRVPLYFLIFSACMNIVLDLLLILVIPLGVAGAAIATVISQGLSGILALIYIVCKVPILHLTRSDWRFDKIIARRELSIGLPMAFQYSITAIGSVMVQTALNGLGSLHVAAFTAASKFDQLANQFYGAIGVTMATYCAQNTGARRLDRIRQGFRTATSITFAYSAVLGILLYYFGYHATRMFINEDFDTVVPLVDTMLKCSSLFLFPLTIVNVFRNGIQGMGYGLLPMTAGIAELVGRGVAAVLAARHNSYWGVCMASPLAWILASALLLIMYVYVIRDTKRRLNLTDGASPDSAQSE